MEGETKGGKEDATTLNGFLSGGVKGDAYVCLVVGVWFGESGSKGFGLHVSGDLYWGLFEEKEGEVREGQERNLLGEIGVAA